MNNVTAYYEPLNRRKWFDATTRGKRVDATHQSVDEYWKEYALIERQDVPWSDDWYQSKLFLPPTSSSALLRRYLELLISSSDGMPVLQFNCVNFRLQWLRTRFPNAAIIHLYRNSRDQWISTFLKTQPVSQSATIREFQKHDEFYLLQWARDLRWVFPILDDIDGMHPYELSYLIWKLSYVYGKNFSDVSVGYEDLTSAPIETLQRIGQIAGCDGLENTPVVKDINPKSVDRWRAYAEDSWFREKEETIDHMLEECVFSCQSACRGNEQ